MLEALAHEAWEVIGSAAETGDIYSSGGEERVRDLLQRLEKASRT